MATTTVCKSVVRGSFWSVRGVVALEFAKHGEITLGTEGRCCKQVPYLAPLPADLALVLLDLHICVDTFAAQQLKVAVASISLLLLQCIYHCKVVFGTPAA